MVDNHYHNDLDTNKLKFGEAIFGAPLATIKALTITYSSHPVSGGDSENIVDGNSPTNAELIFCIQSLTNKLNTVISDMKTLGIIINS